MHTHSVHAWLQYCTSWIMPLVNSRWFKPAYMQILLSKQVWVQSKVINLTGLVDSFKPWESEWRSTLLQDLDGGSSLFPVFSTWNKPEPDHFNAKMFLMICSWIVGTKARKCSCIEAEIRQSWWNAGGWSDAAKEWNKGVEYCCS